jgi:serine/threonine protein kinase
MLGDRYRAINYIGQGGFGRTFKAIDDSEIPILVAEGEAFR